MSFKGLLYILCFSNISIQSAGLQVGNLVRTQNDLDAFAKLYAFFNGIPENVLKDFLAKQTEYSKVAYLDLLRKKEFIIAQDKSVLELPSVLAEMQKRFDAIKEKSRSYGVNDYILKEFLLITVAYEKLSKRFGSFGVQVSKSDVLLETERLKDILKAKEKQKSYLIAEVILETKHFADKTDEGIMNTVQFLLQQMPLEIFALAFGKSINAGVGGSIGIVHESMLTKDVLELMKKPSQMSLVHKNDDVILYVRLKDIKNKDIPMLTDAQIDNKLFLQKYNAKQNALLVDAYAGLVNVV